MAANQERVPRAEAGRSTLETDVGQEAMVLRAEGTSPLVVVPLVGGDPPREAMRYDGVRRIAPIVERLQQFGACRGPRGSPVRVRAQSDARFVLVFDALNSARYAGCTPLSLVEGEGREAPVVPIGQPPDEGEQRLVLRFVPAGYTLSVDDNLVRPDCRSFGEIMGPTVPRRPDGAYDERGLVACVARLRTVAPLRHLFAVQATLTVVMPSEYAPQLFVRAATALLESSPGVGDGFRDVNPGMMRWPPDAYDQARSAATAR